MRTSHRFSHPLGHQRITNDPDSFAYPLPCFDFFPGRLQANRQDHPVGWFFNRFSSFIVSQIDRSVMNGHQHVPGQDLYFNYWFSQDSGGR